MWHVYFIHVVNHTNKTRFGNNLCNLDIPLDERAHGRGWNTNRNWNSTNTGVQGMPNGLACNPLGESSLRSSVYTMYGFALSFAHDDRDSSTEYIARRCAYQVYIASRRSREVQDLRAAFPASPIVAYKYRIHCIRYFKAFPLSRHLIAILRISNAIYHCETCTRENLSDEQSCPRMKYEFTEKTETEIVIKRA